MKEKNNKGITLVALIITIVVLLILAVVSIGAVRNSGIIGYAQNAAGDFKEEKENEIILLGQHENRILENIPLGETDEIVWGEYQGILLYIGTSKDLKVTTDSIQVQEIAIDEKTMQYTRISGKIKTATLADYSYITFELSPNMKTIDFGNKLSRGCGIYCRSEELIELSGLGGLETIGEGAFWDCKSLKEIIVPEGITKIEGQAFNGCDNLIKVVLPSTLTSISYMNFHSSDATVIRPPMEIIINMTREKAESTLGTEWIMNSVTKIIYSDQTVDLTNT